MIQQESDTPLIPVLEAAIHLDRCYQNKIREYQQQIQELEQEVSYWKMLSRSKDERIAELECLVNPYSSDGRSIADSEF